MEPQTESKNKKLVIDFVKFCAQHPELRFWQALRNWSDAEKIYYEKFSEEVEDVIVNDTFYWENKNK